MYRALVRRLVEIADDTARHFDYQSEYVEWHPTVDDFITVARAHELTIQTWKEMEEDDVS